MALALSVDVVVSALGAHSCRPVGWGTYSGRNHLPPVASARMRLGPSLERTFAGLILGPSASQCHHLPHWPTANPVAAARLKRQASHSPPNVNHRSPMFSPPGDFDFIIGHWQVRHRRLNARLSGSTEWTEFFGTSSTRKILEGFGNVEDNVLDFPEGSVRAAAFRSFDAESQSWSIWWLDGRLPHKLDVPVVGKFTEGVGVFYADDTLDGRQIRVRFVWHPNSGGQPKWEQAFSSDGGRTWETNWTMEFRRFEA